MILRNLQLNESDRRELKSKIFASDFDHKNNNLRVTQTLTLNKISTRHENDRYDERENENDRERPRSPSQASRGGLNCDFLLGPSPSVKTSQSSFDNNINSRTSTIGEARIEELTIERCRLDLEGARVLGKALRTSNSSNSAISTLKSLKMVNLAFCNDEHDNINDNASCEILLLLLEGVAEAGKRGGCLESLEFRRIALPSSKNPILRSRFFSALARCQNLRSLKLEDCDIRSEDARDLAETLQSLSGKGKLESLDVSRNHIDGAGLKDLLTRGLSTTGDYHESRSCHSLKRLVLSHNPIADDGAVHLSKFFSRRSTTAPTTMIRRSRARIESLQLVDCDLWSPGCASLAKGLRDFDTLSELVVGGEWEYPHHIEAVAESLQTNVVLKHLRVVSEYQAGGNYDFDYEECGDGGFEPQTVRSFKKAIEHYLALNRAHRKISIDEDLSFNLWPLILGEATAKNHNHKFKAAAAIQPDLWYHLLRRRPELVATDWT